MRFTLPPYIELDRQRRTAEEITVYEGICATTVARAILDCRGLVMTERLLAAATDALREGLLTRAEASQIRSALRRTTEVGALPRPTPTSRTPGASREVAHRTSEHPSELQRPESARKASSSLLTPRQS